ncbi:TlpA family protein disulfide reductase [Hymenobacter sp. RP-2-7]|uniref:TlpA family protein disulfide reductase n=1 Tax=Hymenobacter polaris TaxID=2682546 RepID=A0A7Y0AAT6_9BACT|nr:TlpA disulfide reductase family protein [Hymenobacter polaris]NML63907.1 TlpA family protein disulfide reductase [Hymenobacter polaris]
MRFLIRQLPLAAIGLLAACNSKPDATTATSVAALLTPGPWRGELAMQGQQLPFLFEVKTEANNPVVYLLNKGLNGEERLRCDSISAAGDSVTIRLHVFDAALVVRAAGQGKLQGTWVKYDTKTPYRVPLVATAGQQPLQFDSNGTAGDVLPVLHQDLLKGATYKTTFFYKDGGSYPAVGIFKYNQGASQDALTGTFLTTTGDYRYLAGSLKTVNDTLRLRLSTFDGGHAFLFTGAYVGHQTLRGNYYSGLGGHETWTATYDPSAKLPDADTLTYLKKGESRLNFNFPSIQPGGRISLTDPRYLGKVVVLQILGSWCPNCMDETAYLAPWYAKNRSRGVEIIGLGYERSPDYAQAAARLRTLRQRYSIGYDLAVAGTSNKDSVAKSIPQLAKFLGFPTTIFLDRKGVVRSIRTGFSGPGTGKYYDEEIAHFNNTVDKLLRE